MHTPVLLQEVIDGLQVQANGRYIDATIGEGGHAKAMLKLGATVLGLDQDGAQIERLKAELPGDRCVLVNANFSRLKEVAVAHGFAEADGILFDLGISWRQLSEAGRGLSYKAGNEPLDMQLNDGTLTAAEVLNTYPEEKLYETLARNSEEIRSGDIAREIVERRKHRKYERVADLCKTIDKAVGISSDKIYSRIFQALRIEVNDEFGNIGKGLAQAVEVIKPEGKIAVITFHSVEDRIVKKFIREGGHHQITKKAVRGDRKISFERSAKLRIFSI